MTEFAREAALHWVAVGLYAVSAALFAVAVILQRPGALRWARLAAAAGLVPHGAALAIRWAAVGHGPYMLKYEVLSSNAWVAVALTLLFVWRRPAWAAVGLAAMPVAILAVALGLFSSPRVRELPPTLRSIWLVFHVSFAKLSAAAFLLATATAVLLLLRRRPPAPGSWRARLPDGEALEAYVVRFVGFGLLFWTVTIAAGAIWANQSWGRYWGWDLVETWSLIAWLTYALFLHVRLLFKVRGAATAWMAIGSFGVFILSLLILPLLMPSMHSAYFQ